MEKWLSVSQLSKTLEIPETTVRRYLNHFEEYFRLEQRGRGKKYHPGSIEIVGRIASLYSTDYETLEIKDILSKEFAFTVHDSDQNDTTMQPPAYNVQKEFEEFKQQQEEFNKQLLSKLQEQQDYIKSSIEERDKSLLTAIQIQENKKDIASPEEKRLGRFNEIMAERKVNRMLEKEAIVLWLKKPETERIKKIGWFHKEEDKDKRETFIRGYVDEYFETYMKKEFGIE